MKDITSLCKRVICVQEGSLSYDGELDLLLRKLSPVKEILIVCRSEEDAIKLENFGFNVKNKIKNEITLKIENNSITSSLKTILNNFEIEDLLINEPPIDEIIGKVLIKRDYDI
jgi:ABC-2 type transport system ATP-binding protein